KKPSHIPRPPNAFILFRSYMQRTRFKGGEIPQRKISILLGEEWRGMPEERKAYWNMEAKKVKDAHAQQYPDYRYNP
ncbi:HMG-box, partial [Cubamyces sp. BRFM 1775]